MRKKRGMKKESSKIYIDTWINKHIIKIKQAQNA